MEWDWLSVAINLGSKLLLGLFLIAVFFSELKERYDPSKAEVLVDRAAI